MGGAQKNRSEGGFEGGVRCARNFLVNPPPCRSMFEPKAREKFEHIPHKFRKELHCANKFFVSAPPPCN